MLLVHQLPPKPDYVRVKVRRRLRKLGAVALKNSVYVLSETDEHLEDFQWLANEIVADGGDATICSATLLSGISDADLDALFHALPTQRGSKAEREAEPTPRGSAWVTRQNVFVDRIASAWLIRRFIDPDAHFKFVASRGYRPKPGELRFDMFEAEFTHVGDRCTFEVLVESFGLTDAALRAIGEIVHDIDLKDDKFGRNETAGVLAIMDGIVRDRPDDADRVERGALMLDAVYARLERRR